MYAGNGPRPAVVYGPKKMAKILSQRGIASSTGKPMMLDPRDGVALFDDFINIYVANRFQSQLGWNDIAVGTGSTHTNANCTDDAIGIHVLRSGSTETDRSVLYLSLNGLVLAGRTTYFEARVRFPGLSIASDQFETYIGLSDTQTENDPTNGVNFLYEQKTNGDFWEAQVIGGSTETSEVLDGGGGRETAAVAIDTWYRLGIEVDDVTGGGTPEARFYVDDTLKSTITTNLPTTGEDMGIILKQQSATGDTVASTNDLYVDYVYFAQVLTSRR